MSTEQISAIAEVIRQVAAGVRENVYPEPETEFQRTYSAAMNDAADFLIDRATELESTK